MPVEFHLIIEDMSADRLQSLPVGNVLLLEVEDREFILIDHDAFRDLCARVNMKMEQS